MSLNLFQYKNPKVLVLSAIIALVFIVMYITSPDLTIKGSNQWPNHDISTLRLLQVIHRHGDRTPAMFGKNDPFKHQKYWKESPGSLTNYGRYRMYKKGQFIRNAYMDYLGDKYSKEEVFDRSSEVLRTIESAQALLAGAYPPLDNSQKWDFGSDAVLGEVWQPIPVVSFIPLIEDYVCTEEATCPALEAERKRIFSSPEVIADMKPIFDFCENLTNILGPLEFDFPHKGLEYLYYMFCLAGMARDLMIETKEGYIWLANEENIINKSTEYLYKWKQHYWGTPLAIRLALGGLITELDKNIKKVLNKTNDKKLYIYSSHDSNIEGFRHALHIEDDSWPEFGATLLIELHEKSGSGQLSEGSNQLSDWFIRIFYHNSTEIDSNFIPHTLNWRDCSHPTDCPLDEYLSKTNPYLIDNHKKVCEIQS